MTTPLDLWLQKVLDQLILLHESSYRGADFSMMTELAYYAYAPAKPIFIGYLSDESELWRYQSLMALGFYYDVHADSDMMEKIRQVSLHDPDDTVRACAISIWVSQRRVLDKHLLHILEYDPDRAVRMSALGSLLLCYHPVIRGKYHDMMERAKTGKNKDWLTEKGIKKLFVQLGIEWKVSD